MKTNKKSHSKLKKKTVCFLILLATMAIGILLSFAVFFRVEDICIEGNFRYSDDEILNASNIKKGDNLFLCNPIKVREKIIKKLPYIENVRVSKKIPNKIILYITDAVAKGSIAVDESFAIINDKGKLLEIVDVNVPELMVIESTGVHLDKKENVIVFDDEVDKVILNDIMQQINNWLPETSLINLRDKSNITIKYQDRIDIFLGIPEKIERKMKIASKIIAEKLSEKDAGRLNLSLVLDNEHIYFTPYE